MKTEIDVLRSDLLQAGLQEIALRGEMASVPLNCNHPMVILQAG